MTHRKHLITCVLLISLFALLLSGCAEKREIRQNRGILELTQVVTPEDFAQFEKYPDLQRLDLRGSNCYDEIIAFAQSHPELQVQYDIALAGKRYAPDVKELTFAADEVSIAELKEALPYLPYVTALSFPDTNLLPTEIEELKASLPNIEISYTATLAGALHTPDETSFDFSALTPEELDAAIEQLAYFPDASQIELMNAEGTSPFSPADVKKLQEALPSISLNYSFDLFGKTVTLQDEILEYDEVEIGNEGEAQIREALDILTNCKYAKFDDCGIDSTVMAGIRDDYPEVKVVWRIHVGKYSLLTDETMMRLTFILKDENVSELKYCTDIVYMDVGHNDYLSDFSFISYMPNLECAIVSGSCFGDLSVFENCKKLVWLELCYCGYVKDASPLKDLTNLKYLNVSFTSIDDVTVLDNLPLERFVCMGLGLNSAERDYFTEKHPDCIFVHKGRQPFGYGWRYNDYGYTFFDYYKQMRAIFRYDDESYTGNMKGK